MKLIRDLDELTDADRGGAVTIGNFDGVHRGHARILARLVALAREVGRPALVFTFDPHPVRLLRPEVAPPPLTWTERKAELLSKQKVDITVAYPTDMELLRLAPEEFFERIVRGALGATAIVEGPNFYFGRHREGNVERLAQLCDSAGIRLEVVPPAVHDDQIVSSSRIRNLIRAGDVATARRLLTEPYRIRGIVIHGARRGAALGFPTANLEGIDTLMPPIGVYAGRSWVNGVPVASAVHIGPNPTFGEQHPKVEVHLIDYEGALYGQVLEVDFVDRLRDIQAFPSIEALRDQLHRDVESARRAVALCRTAGDS